MNTQELDDLLETLILHSAPTDIPEDLENTIKDISDIVSGSPCLIKPELAKYQQLLSALACQAMTMGYRLAELQYEHIPGRQREVKRGKPHQAAPSQ